MRIFKAPLWAASMLLLAGPALGQEMFPGQSVTVNPGATGGRTLLYPGGEYLRQERPLLQPFQRPASAPLQLHLPGTKRAVAVSAPKPVVRKAAPAPVAEPAVAEAPPPPAPKVTARPAPAKPPEKPVAKQVAKTEPVPARPQPAQAPVAGEMAGWTPNGLIEFTPGQGEVAGDRMDAVRFLAGSLSNKLSASPAMRIQILAYGGTRGDKGSDARRLSLRRALSVRQILIDSGVSKDQIDVRAMGGADDGGPADRVDVYTRS